jgi:hypothetical protein
VSENTLDFIVAPRVERSYIIVCLILLPLAVFFSLVRPWGQTADLWETAAAVRAVAQNFAHPQNPLLDLPGSTSPRFTPYTLFWGAVMSGSGLSVLAVMALAGISNFLLFVTGLFRFVSRITRAGILPTYMLLIMLIVWGTGYGEANGYQLRLFFETLPYVGIFAYGVTFHAVGYLRKFLDFQRPRDVAFYTLLMAIVFVTHPITAAFGFVAAVAMLMAERDWRKLVLMQGVPLLALIAALMWPYFDYWKVLTRGSGEAWFVAPLFQNQVEALGSALVGIPIVVYYALKQRHPFVVYGLVLCLVVYFMSYVFQILIGSRFLLFAVFFMHLAIAVYLYEHGMHRRRHLEGWLSSHGYLLIIVFVVFVPGMWNRAHELAKHVRRMYDPPAHFHAYVSPVRPSFFLKDQLAERNVVLADDSTAWVVPAITGAKIVSQQKGDPLITAEINVRRQSVQAFLYRPISTRERVAIIRRYRVTHILLDENRANEWNETLLRDLELVAAPQARRGNLSLYRVTI